MDARVTASTSFNKNKTSNIVHYIPMTGAKRHELPINGKPFGPGTSEYGFINGSLGLE